MSLQPRSPLFVLLENGDMAALRTAVELLPQHSAETLELLTWLLIDAAERGELSAAELLFAHGADVNGNAFPRPYIRPLWKAAKRGHLEMVKFLLSKGAKPQQGDNDGLLPIDYAKRYSRREVAQFLEGL